APGPGPAPQPGTENALADTQAPEAAATAADATADEEESQRGFFARLFGRGEPQEGAGADLAAPEATPGDTAVAAPGEGEQAAGELLAMDTVDHRLPDAAAENVETPAASAVPEDVAAAPAEAAERPGPIRGF